jgi:rRNA maturation endonuclease Nob1
MTQTMLGCRSCGETFDRDRLKRTPSVVARTLFCPSCGSQFSQTPPPAPHQKHAFRK